MGNPDRPKKVALIGEAKVMRPRMGGKESILSLTASRQWLEDSIPKIKEAFAKKGYQVVYAEPAGVGYHWRGYHEYWVYNYSAKKGEPDRWQLNGEPAFEYPAIKQQENLRNSVRTEFERINDSIAFRRFTVYDPKKENLAFIKDVSNADAICFVRLWGKRYSSGRVAGDIAISLAAAMFGVYRTGNLQMTKEISVVCADAETAEVLWQNSLHVLGDPLASIASQNDQINQEEDDGEIVEDSNIADKFYDQALENLPKANESLANNCRMINRVNNTVACATKKSSQQADVSSDF